MIHRSELGHHRVVEWLRALISVVGKGECGEHSEEREALVCETRRRRGYARDPFTHERQPELPERRYYNGGDTGNQSEANYPGLALLSSVGNGAEDRYGYDHQRRSNSVYGRVKRI